MSNDAEFEEDVGVVGFGSQDGYSETFRLRLGHAGRRITIDYTPAIMSETVVITEDGREVTKFEYDLEHFKKRIEWCIRKSFE